MTMKRMILSALFVAVALPASAKTWVDVECSRVLVSVDDRFLIQDRDNQLVSCAIEKWPLNTPTADLACANGVSAKIEVLGDSTLLWNGIEMNAYDGPLPCGANGAEWPD